MSGMINACTHLEQLSFKSVDARGRICHVALPCFLPCSPCGLKVNHCGAFLLHSTAPGRQCGSPAPPLEAGLLLRLFCCCCSHLCKHGDAVALHSRITAMDQLRYTRHISCEQADRSHNHVVLSGSLPDSVGSGHGISIRIRGNWEVDRRTRPFNGILLAALQFLLVSMRCSKPGNRLLLRCLEQVLQIKLADHARPVALQDCMHTACPCRSLRLPGMVAVHVQ